MNTEKTYSNKGNAARAAKAAGPGYEAVPVDETHPGWGEGKFMVRKIEAAPVAPAADPVKALRGRKGIKAAAKVATPAPARPAKARASGGGKLGMVMERLLSPKGISYAEITELTNWTRFGSIFTKAKKDGVLLRSVKEGTTSRLFGTAGGRAAGAGAKTVREKAGSEARPH